MPAENDGEGNIIRLIFLFDFCRHGVKIEFDKDRSKLKMFGSKKSIDALTEHVQSKITNCKTTAHAKLAREHFFFLKKFVFGEQFWLLKVCYTNLQDIILFLNK